MIKQLTIWSGLAVEPMQAEEPPMTAEGNNSSSITSYQKNKERQESLYLFSDTQITKREKLLHECGWEGHVLGQLDEVRAVSL